MPNPLVPDHDEQTYIDRMEEKIGKYDFVVAVSKRARLLKERLIRLPSATPIDAIGMAVDDIAKGRVKIRRQEEVEE
jgi:DNA-directed RNA polymerase subunit K/omega